MGRIRSLDRLIFVNRYSRTTKGVVLRTSIDRDGYPYVRLSRNGSTTSKRVHQLVMITFVGPAPEGMEVRHLNGDTLDSRLVNLCYGTHRDNVRDKLWHAGGRVSYRPDECANGHQWTEESAYIRTKTGAGKRECRICRREQDLRHYYKKRQRNTVAS